MIEEGPEAVVVPTSKWICAKPSWLASKSCFGIGSGCVITGSSCFGEGNGCAVTTSPCVVSCNGRVVTAKVIKKTCKHPHTILSFTRRNMFSVYLPIGLKLKSLGLRGRVDSMGGRSDLSGDSSYSRRLHQKNINSVTQTRFDTSTQGYVHTSYPWSFLGGRHHYRASVALTC